jgi:hypothetical protein
VCNVVKVHFPNGFALALDERQIQQFPRYPPGAGGWRGDVDPAVAAAALRSGTAIEFTGLTPTFDRAEVERLASQIDVVRCDGRPTSWADPIYQIVERPPSGRAPSSPGAVDMVESNHGPQTAREASPITSEDWVLPTGGSQADQIRAALDWLAQWGTPPLPWKELAEKSQESRDKGRGESVGWRKYEIRVREMLGIKPDDDPTEKTLANIKAVRLKWVAAKLATEARDTQERPPMRGKRASNRG